MARRISIAALAVVLLAAATATAEMETRRDIAYADPADSQRRLDVYFDKQAKGRPVVVWIHGGAWRFGNKRGVQEKPRGFVEQGYVFVSVGYRFVPNVTVREQGGDIAKAIRWVYDHHEEINASQDIFVMGHSAGAHLAAFIGADERLLKQEGLSLKLLRGVAPVDTGAYDVAARIQSAGPIGARIYTSVFTEQEASQRDASPLAYVKRGKSIPPFLVLHVADRVDSTAQSRKFVAALQKAGVRAKLFAAKDKSHRTINHDLGKADDPPTKAVFAFLKECLGAKR